MNVRRTLRNLVILGLAGALPASALWHGAFAAAPAHDAAGPARPLQALSARLHALLAPAPAADAVAYSPAFHLTDYMAPLYAAPKSRVNFQKAGSLAAPRPVLAAPHITSPTTDPVTLVPYSANEVIHITNAAGQTVRAATAALDVAPNQPLTFTVTVDNVLTDANGNPLTGAAASTHATAVYLQFKNPNSAYQGTDGLEHKVFTTDGVNTNNGDDGSATSVLFNGGNGSPYSNQNNVLIPERGSVGGTEGTDQFLGIGQGITGPAMTFTVAASGTTPAHTVQGVDNQFIASGQEYECQFLTPFDNGVSTPQNPSGYTGTGNATAANYGTPYYLAGYDDQTAASFPGVPTLPVNTTPANGGRPDWLALHPVPGNANQYTATWCPPASRSDFYVDAVVVDNQNNWRIFDNVWGFSTLPFQGTNDILFVADNVLGQKFAASALASRGLSNLRPVFYGAESYFTGTDVSLLPNAVYDYGSLTQVGGTGNGLRITRIGQNFGGFQQNADYFAYNPYTVGPDGNFLTVINGLGYGSYADSVDTNTAPLQTNTSSLQYSSTQLATEPVGDAAGQTYPKSQAYSIWRILSRGALDPTLLTRTPAQGGYARDGFAGDGSTGTQPAVADPVTGFTAPASSTVPVNTRCVVWSSPFTGDQPLNTAGSILDSATQQILRRYVTNGGRLFVSGQEIASALTLNGTPSLNAAGGFVYDVLNAQYVAPTTGNPVDNQTLTGVAAGPLSFDAFFNFLGPGLFDGDYHIFFQRNPTNTTFVGPGAVVPALGNDYVESASTALSSLWRTDGALTELGPFTRPVGGSTIQSNINLVTPVNGAIPQFGIGGSNGMIYKSDTTDAVGSGFGSKTIFASFGLEGVGIEYYKVTIGNPGVDYFFPRNVRPNILNNVVDYLRTGSYEGRIFLGSSTSQGVPGATVYLIPFHGAAIPGPRPTYSATTSDGTDGRPVGSYHIDGLEPGAYIAVAYKTGFSRSATPTNNSGSGGQDGALGFTAEGDTTATNVNLNISPLPPGSIAGKVTLGTASGAGVPNATVTFTTTDGTVVTVTTDANGNYAISAPAGVYSGIATSTTPAATSPTQTGITVNTGQTTQNVNFVLTPSPGHITGTAALTGVSATTTTTATVSFAITGTTAPVATTPVTLTGTTVVPFTSPALAAGAYTVTISAPSYVATNTAGDAVTLAAGATTAATPTLTLRPAAAVTLTGRVTDASSGAAVPSATVTVKDPAGNTVITAPATVSTNGSGVFTATVPEGTYQVSAGAVSYLTSTATTVTLTAANDPPVNIALTHAPSLYNGYTAGRYNLISYPQDNNGSPIPFDSIFGTQVTAANPNGNRGPALIYSASAANYLAEPTAPADGAHRGLGYFVFLKNAAGIYSPLLGTAPTAPTVTVALQGGWNMIGVPSTNAVTVSRLGVQVPSTGSGGGTSTLPFLTAANTSRAVLLNIYGFNPASGSAGAYYVADPNGVGALQPFQGYWVYAYMSGLHLVIPTTGP